MPIDPQDPHAAIAEGIRLFNAGQFFETHEVLEEAWRPATGPMKVFLKGLIHAAVALYQYERRNVHGACSKYQSTHYYLDDLSPAYAGVDIRSLLDEMDRFFDPLPQGPEGPWRSPDLPRPRLRMMGSDRG